MDYELMMNGNVKIGEEAPNFIAESTKGEIDLNKINNKWVILFSYVNDFEGVSMTELLAFQKIYDDLEKLNIEILAINTDGILSHFEFINNIKLNLGIEIKYPIISDKNGEICRKYGMISSKINPKEANRNVYIISPEKRIIAIMSYPVEIGRSIAEIVRIVKALKNTEGDTERAPANWLPGYPNIKKINNLEEDNNTLWYFKLT